MLRFAFALLVPVALATAGGESEADAKQAWKTYKKSMRELTSRQRAYERKELGRALRDSLQKLKANWQTMVGRPDSPNEFVFVMEGFDEVYSAWASKESRKASFAYGLVPVGGEPVAKEIVKQILCAVKTIVAQDKLLETSKPRHFVLVHEQKPGVLRHGAYSLLDGLVCVLGELRDEKALEYILTSGMKKAAAFDKRSRRDLARIALIDALGLTGNEQVVPFLHAAAKSEEPRIRIAALEALAQVAKDSDDFVEAIRSDRCYAVRLAALELMQFSVERMPVLIDAYAKAKGLERSHLRSALGGIVGRDLGPPADNWRSWYEANKERPTRPCKRPNARTVAAEDAAVLSGIRSSGSQIYLILDAGYFGTTPADLKLARSQQFNHWSKMPAVDRDYVTQWQLERREVTAFLESLQEGMGINILTIDRVCGFTPFDKKKMVRITDSSKRRVLAHVADIKPRAWSWAPAIQAIWRAYEQGGADPWGTEVPDEPGVDTIYLVGDSVPGAGHLIHLEAVIDDVKRHHRFYRIPIHCVRVGYTEKSGETMKRIAQATGGKYVWHQKP